MCGTFLVHLLITSNISRAHSVTMLLECYQLQVVATIQLQPTIVHKLLIYPHEAHYADRDPANSGTATYSQLVINCQKHENTIHSSHADHAAGNAQNAISK